jgi:hypothetical protein
VQRRDAGDAEAMQKSYEKACRTFRKAWRLTLALSASILTSCFFLPSPVLWVVVDRRRRVARGTARFFPAHPVKRVGFVFIRFLPVRADVTNLERFEFIKHN